MASSTIDKSQRTAARIAGLAFPISFAIVVAVNFGIFARLIVSGNPAETARNILAHETLFRIGVAGDMAYCVGTVVLLTALYVILKPVSENLALLGIRQAGPCPHVAPGDAQSLYRPATFN